MEEHRHIPIIPTYVSTCMRKDAYSYSAYLKLCGRGNHQPWDASPYCWTFKVLLEYSLDTQGYIFWKLQGLFLISHFFHIFFFAFFIFFFFFSGSLEQTGRIIKRPAS